MAPSFSEQREKGGGKGAWSRERHGDLLTFRELRFKQKQKKEGAHSLRNNRHTIQSETHNLDLRCCCMWAAADNVPKNTCTHIG